MKTTIAKFTVVFALISSLFSVQANAHSSHADVVSGFIHFMTEPDHLALSAVVAAALFFVIRNIISKRS